MVKIILSFFISFSFFSCQQKNTDKEKADVAIICDSIFNELSRGKTTNSFKILEHNSQIPIRLIDTLRMTYTVQMSNFLIGKYGGVPSYEFISEKKINDSMVERHYVIKFERYTMPFDFTLHNNGTNWRIVRVNYNNELIIN